MYNKIIRRENKSYRKGDIEHSKWEAKEKQTKRLGKSEEEREKKKVKLMGHKIEKKQQQQQQ